MSSNFVRDEKFLKMRFPVTKSFKGMIADCREEEKKFNVIVN